MLSSAQKSEDLLRNSWFADELNARLDASARVQCLGYDELLFEFTSEGTEIFIRETRQPLSDFDMVYFKSVFRNTELSTIIARYLKKHTIAFICDEHLDHQPTTKLSQLDRLGDAGLPIPQTLYVAPTGWRDGYSQVTHRYGTPFILKAIDGLKGSQNYLVHDRSEYDEIIKEQAGVQFIAEEFLPNDGDYRVLVLDDTIGMIIERQRDSKETHLNNTSQGGQATRIAIEDFDKNILDMSVQAAEILGRNVAGVDVLIRNTDNKPFILEVNASPQISSGAFVDEKLDMFAHFLSLRVKNGNLKSDAQLIGVSSYVDFVGYKNLKSIPARIDTGARTSSLWASDVTIKKGVATFKLFGPGSPWYTGKVVKRTVMEQREVTSSTGHTQLRHLITLSVRINGKRLNAKFTLADRSTQTYPILIGRNTLRGNFLVDSGNPGEARLYKYPEEAIEFNESEAA